MPSLNSTPPPTSGSTDVSSIAITPELIKKITAKVYALMQADLKTERERQQRSPQTSCVTNGGRHAS